MIGTLHPLQVAILRELATVRPRWTLTGGGALAGFHLAHRTTRDLDLCWHGRDTLDREVETCRDVLHDAGLEVHVLQQSRSFARLRAVQGDDSVVVDLVAEPVPAAEPPLSVSVGGTDIQIDSRHEILVNKLGTLLHRAELRDLIDVRALLASGGELERAMADAAAKNGGFSTLTLGWMLESFPLRPEAEAERWDQARIEELEEFLTDLARRVAKLARP